MDPIKGAPSPGFTYDSNDPVYGDQAALKGEIDRYMKSAHTPDD